MEYYVYETQKKQRKITVYCAVCGKPKIINPCRYKEGKRFFCNPEHQKEGQRGRTLSEATKKKISGTKGGISTEVRICKGCGINFEVPKWSKKIYHDRQCSSTIIGRLSNDPWNKGLTKENNERLKQMGEKHSQWLQKQYTSGKLKIWNKGLTVETDERMRKLSDHLTQMRNTEGPWKEAWRESMRKGQVKAHAAGKHPRTFTIPEQLTWNYLESLGYVVKAFSDKSDDDLENTWYHQYNFEDAFVPDFACPDQRCIIEVNGCYHHGHYSSKCNRAIYKRGNSDYVENNIKRDRRKYSMYHRHGWKWALVWECEAHDGDFHRLQERLGM